MSSPMTVTVRYWAAAKEAAGLAEEQVEAGTLADALAQARSRHGDRPRFEQVLGLCSVLVDGDPVGGRDPATVRLAPGARIELLPPFAGG
ncbi:MoaD/ThiS family protein [Actinopolymorpha rutila]|uniref:Molybdopterin converting factor small subunit n=1 Tax=Actinopolymorpha rutila TaxID=446787 RepID=A0A852Z5G5_9ACTN|nr:molybdopterin converting factor small subunit [Actinopolymorpha rutila]